jgi:hypothetical protein
MKELEKFRGKTFTCIETGDYVTINKHDEFYSDAPYYDRVSVISDEGEFKGVIYENCNIAKFIEENPNQYIIDYLEARLKEVDQIPTSDIGYNQIWSKVYSLIGAIEGAILMLNQKNNAHSH